MARELHRIIAVTRVRPARLFDKMAIDILSLTLARKGGKVSIRNRYRHPDKRDDGKRLVIEVTPEFEEEGGSYHRIVGVYRHRPRSPLFGFERDDGYRNVLRRCDWLVVQILPFTG